MFGLRYKAKFYAFELRPFQRFEKLFRLRKRFLPQANCKPRLKAKRRHSGALIASKKC